MDPPPLGAFALPEILIEEVQPDAGPPESFAAGELWSFQREILLADELDRAFTVEPGTWREVISLRPPRRAHRPRRLRRERGHDRTLR